MFTVTESTSAQPISAMQQTRMLTYVFEPSSTLQDLEAMVGDALSKSIGATGTWDASMDTGGHVTITVTVVEEPVVP